MSDWIGKLLKETDGQRQSRHVSDASELAGRVLKIRKKRRAVRISSVGAMIVIVVGASIFGLSKRTNSMRQVASSQSDPGTKARLVQEINRLQAQVEANDRMIRQL